MTDMELAEEIERHPVTLTLPHTCKPDSLQVDIDGRALTYEENQQIIAALRRGHERPPSGEMVMVPREPTEAMLIAGYEAHQQAGPQREKWLAASYRAMLSACEEKK